MDGISQGNLSVKELASFCPPGAGGGNPWPVQQAHETLLSALVVQWLVNYATGILFAAC